MTIWNSTSSTSFNNVNYGVTANDGSGDNLRDAFIKVDNNFGNVSQWLSGTFPEFINANVDGTVSAQWANVTNANVGTLGNSLGGQITVTSGLLPSVDGAYNLGSPSRQFGTIYYKNAVQSGTTTTVDAGLLKVHANAFPGDIQDTGILGNVSSDYTQKSYVFFGHQYTTNDFIYKTIGYDATLGNNIIDGGTYGNVHFGSAFLSNATASADTNTGALIVSGGAGIGGNLNIGGNIVNNNPNANLSIAGSMFAQGGYQVVTTSIIGNYGNPYIGGIVAGNTVFLSSAVSTSGNTGAVSIPYGGLGVYGNIVSTTGFVSPSYYGIIRTADQPYITSLGTLPTLNAISGSFTSLGTTGLTTTGLVNLSGPTLTIASNTSISSYANVAAGLIVGANAWVGGNLTVVNNTSLSNLNVATSTTIGNAITVGTATTLTNSFTGINTNAAVTVDSFNASTYGSAKYLIQLVDSGYTPNKVQTAEMSLTHDRNGSSTLVYVNTYGVVSNQGNVGLGSFAGSYVSGAIRLQFTPSYSPSSLAIKVLRTSITL
jgi:hypothetical protein